MIPATVQQDFDMLPPDAQQQIIDFIQYIKCIHQKKQSITEEQKAEKSFGMIKVRKKVTLEQMDSAIERAGASL